MHSYFCSFPSTVQNIKGVNISFIASLFIFLQAQSSFIVVPLDSFVLAQSGRVQKLLGIHWNWHIAVISNKSRKVEHEGPLIPKVTSNRIGTIYSDSRK